VLFYGAANAGIKAIMKKRKDRVAFFTRGWAGVCWEIWTPGG